MSSGSQPRVITKPLVQRMKELIRALLVLRDAVGAVESGHPHQILPVFGLLRALLTEKAKQNKPLLVDLASLLGKELLLFAYPGTDEAPSPFDLSTTPLLVGGFPVSRHRTNPHQKQLHLAEFLDQKMLFLRGRHYSRRDLIKMFAEKGGGAHFPEKVPEDFAVISTLEVGGISPVDNALLQVGKASLECGVDLLRQLCDFSLHFYILVPSNPFPNAGVLFDASYPGTPMRMALSVSAFGQLTFEMVGLDGFSAKISTDRMPDWSEPRHIAVEHSIGTQLDSRLTIHCDGELYLEATIPHPLFLTNELNQYRRLMNRSQADANAGLTFAMLNHMLRVGALGLSEQCALLEFFRRIKAEANTECLLFRRGSFGETKPGTRSMVMTGNVKMWDWKRMLAGELPE